MSLTRKNFAYLVCLALVVLMKNSNSIQTHARPVYTSHLLVLLSDTEDPSNSQKNNDKGSDSSAQPLDQNQKERKLKTLIEGEAKRQGLITGIMSGVVFLYSSISDLLLHPVLTIVISTLTIGLVILAAFIVVLLRREDFSTLGKLVSFGILYLLLYIDLLFIMYEQRKLTMSFFMLDKDILLVVLAAIVGYFIGRSSSRQVFEEKVLP